MKDGELRAAGIDVEAMRADARATVDAATPPGWQVVMIRNPWPEAECPFCGSPIAVHNMGVAALTRPLQRARVVLFVLAVVCDACVGE